MNKGNNMQEDADSLTQFNKSNLMFVQTFKILGLIVPEKSLIQIPLYLKTLALIGPEKSCDKKFYWTERKQDKWSKTFTSCDASCKSNNANYAFCIMLESK